MQTRLRIACLSLALIAISPLFAQPPAQRDFGRGAPFNLEELPKGQLKNKVKKLKPQVRAEALKRLHTFSFPESDAAKFPRVDDNGGVFIVCPIEGCGQDCKTHDHDHGDVESTLEGEGAVAAQTGNANAENIPIGDGTNETFNPSSPVPVSAPPVFNSKPGAPFHIYLDFSGAYVTGKHVGEDPNTTRADETLGYIVIESGTGVIDGIAFEAALGGKSVQGCGNSASSYTYVLSGNLNSTSAAAVSLSGVSETDGAWAVLSGSPAFTSDSIGLHACEDKLKDSEQGHVAEHAGYIVFE